MCQKRRCRRTDRPCRRPPVPRYEQPGLRCALWLLADHAIVDHHLCVAGGAIRNASGRGRGRRWHCQWRERQHTWSAVMRRPSRRPRRACRAAALASASVRTCRGKRRKKLSSQVDAKRSARDSPGPPALSCGLPSRQCLPSAVMCWARILCLRQSGEENKGRPTRTEQ